MFVYLLKYLWDNEKRWFFSVSDYILSVRDYVERLSTYFNLKNQSKHFENSRSLSIESFNIEFLDENYNPQSQFYSHFSDDSRQDISTTHAHIIYMLKELEKGNKLKRKCTV